jgi:hypothetical protein
MSGNQDLSPKSKKAVAKIIFQNQLFLKKYFENVK